MDVADYVNSLDDALAKEGVDIKRLNDINDDFLMVLIGQIVGTIQRLAKPFVKSEDFSTALELVEDVVDPDFLKERKAVLLKQLESVLQGYGRGDVTSAELLTIKQKLSMYNLISSLEKVLGRMAPKIIRLIQKENVNERNNNV